MSLPSVGSYGTHQATPEFRRIITTILDSKGVMEPRAVVQYLFLNGKKVAVRVKCHGNSKRKQRPYYRTQPSTLPAIREKCKTESPSVAYSDVFEAAGGIQRCKSMSEEPRNKSQVYNACKSVKSETVSEKDEIFDLLSLLKEHQSMEDGGFLRELLSLPTGTHHYETVERIVNPFFLVQLSSTWNVGLKIIKHSFPASSSTSPACVI